MRKRRNIANIIRSFFLILISPASLALALLFAISGAAGFINPAENDLFAVVGLFYPILFVALVANVIVLLIFRSKWIYLHLLLLLAFLPISLRYIGFHTHNSNEGWKIMTYNVHGFRGFHKTLTNNTTHKEIIAYIQKENLDMVCLQEFRSWTGNIENDTRTFASEAGFKHFHFTGYWRKGGVQSDGYLILSKLPIMNTGAIPSKTKRNIGAFVDVKTPNQEVVRIASVHLISFSLGKQEIEAFGEAAALEMNLLKKHGRSLLGKFRNSFNIRAKEIIDLQSFVKDTELPLLVCGDFNDTPASFTYSNMIETGLKDGHIQADFGLGATYAGNLPWLRIDYFFLSKHLKATSSEVIHLPYSDHYPVQVRIISSTITP